MKHMRFVPTLVVAALLSAFPAARQTAVVLRAARWLDVSAGVVRAPAVVAVEGDRIASVGAEAPAGARTVDLGDVTLLPGLIDAHTHLTGDIEGDWVTRPVRELPADAALRGARNAKRTVEAGFTTVRDVGAGGFADVSLMKAIDAGNGKATLTEVSGGTLTATKSGSTIMLTDESGGMAHVTIADVVQSNGVIHVVDKVLLPK